MGKRRTSAKEESSRACSERTAEKRSLKRKERASSDFYSGERNREAKDVNSKKERQKAVRKKVFRALTRVICFPFLLAKKIIRLKKKKKEVEREEEEEYIKEVTFSDTITIHTYVPKKNASQKITLKKITQSLPPASLEMANRIKGSSRETPLVKKILEKIDTKTQELEEIRKLLKIKPAVPEKKSKNKIITILGSYDNLTDSPDNRVEHKEEAVPRAPEKKSKKKREKTKKKIKKARKVVDTDLSDDNISSAAAKAYDTMVRRNMSFTPT